MSVSKIYFIIQSNHMVAYLLIESLRGIERTQLSQAAQSYKAITLNPWAISDLELIAIGGFSPLTGFMGQEDYNQVIEKTHLTDGSVWSIPITLPVTEDVASKLEIGDHIALYGEDGALYMAL